jgi:riboflavin synthase
VTTLLKRQQGDKVNIECDMIGKYVEKFTLNREMNIKKSNIDEAFLKENGFF